MDWLTDWWLCSSFCMLLVYILHSCHHHLSNMLKEVPHFAPSPWNAVEIFLHLWKLMLFQMLKNRDQRERKWRRRKKSLEVSLSIISVKCNRVVFPARLRTYGVFLRPNADCDGPAGTQVTHLDGAAVVPPGDLVPRHKQRHTPCILVVVAVAVGQKRRQQ